MGSDLYYAAEAAQASRDDQIRKLVRSLLVQWPDLEALLSEYNIEETERALSFFQALDTLQEELNKPIF